MKKNIFSCLGILLFVLAASGPASGQQDVVLTIRDGQPAISIALPAFMATDRAKAAATEIHAVLEADLKYTRIFALLPKSYYAYIQTQNLRTIRFEDWQSINAAVLFTGEVTLAGNGDLVLERNFYDVKSKKQILPGKRYQAKTGRPALPGPPPGRRDHEGLRREAHLHLQGRLRQRPGRQRRDLHDGLRRGQPDPADLQQGHGLLPRLVPRRLPPGLHLLPAECRRPLHPGRLRGQADDRLDPGRELHLRAGRPTARS